jgi:hypothetical protein
MGVIEPVGKHLASLAQKILPLLLLVAEIVKVLCSADKSDNNEGGDGD